MKPKLSKRRSLMAIYAAHAEEFDRKGDGERERSEESPEVHHLEGEEALMPCYSRVTETKMLDHARLATALAMLGHKVQRANQTVVEADGITFFREDVRANFRTESTDAERLSQIGRKYAELTVRGWARKNGLVVKAADETKIVLTSTRK
jgi:hypothetical protein